MLRLLSVVVLVSACAGAPPPLEAADFDVHLPWKRDQGAASSEPLFYSASYHLTWEGRRIGEAREVFQRSARGVRLVRTERIRIRRGGVPVESETEVVIDADPDLRAVEVKLRAQAGAISRSGRAVRADDGGWVVSLDGEPLRTAPADAVPAELVPFLAAEARGDRFETRILLAGYGFAVADLKVIRDGQRAFVVLGTPWGELESELRLAGDGRLLTAASGPVGAVRVEPARLDENFEPPELLDASAIPLSGAGEVLVLEGARRPPPPLLGQSIEIRDRRWRVRYDTPGPVSDPTIAAVTREVTRLLGEGLDAPGAGAKSALALGRGDCTAHASLFVELAAERGLEARMVTGYRVDGERLVRHRWAAVRRGKRWVPVDPTFGEAPAPPGRHLALAMHGPAASDVALVDEVVFAGLAGARARWEPGPVARR